MHGMVGVHLVHQADLDRLAFGEAPVDGGVGGAGGAVHQLPPHVGRGGEPVDRHHVVFPLDTPAATVAVPVTVVAVVCALVIVAAVCVWRRGGLAPGWLAGKGCDQEFHAAL